MYNLVIIVFNKLEFKFYKSNRLLQMQRR